MGMFDWVDHPTQPCWRCQSPVGGWQSKDADNELATVPPSRVTRFYAACDSCSAWNEYRVVAHVVTIEPAHGREWEEARDAR